MAWHDMRAARVAVVDEHEIFRRGVVACLGEDPFLVVFAEGSSGPIPGETDVAVVSPRVAAQESLAAPLVLCSPDPGARHPIASDNRVLAILPRNTLTPEELIAAVRAVAAGLRVEGEAAQPAELERIVGRRLEVLRLLAQGADTQEISEALRYSQRTIKALIHEIEVELGARNRAQAVAEGIRLGLI